jgi:hypothetical protein
VIEINAPGFEYSCTQAKAVRCVCAQAFFGSYRNKSNRPVWGFFVCGSHWPPCWSLFSRPWLLKGRAAGGRMAARALAHPLSQTATRSRVRMEAFFRVLAQDSSDRGNARSRGSDGGLILIGTFDGVIVSSSECPRRLIPIPTIHRTLPITSSRLPTKVPCPHRRIVVRFQRQ